ncbi:MAG: hypothetical protein LBC31_07355 [Treponema sp.]|jgi:hypothetical protein|nr:hypothetical protein [Treponema sp.]
MKNNEEDKPLLKSGGGKKVPDRSGALTIIAAVLIVAAAVVITCLNRFTGVFVSGPTEKKIAKNLDLKDPLWVESLAELILPPCEKDFSIYGAFSYAGERSGVTQVYATMAAVDDIRLHYLGLLENPLAPDTNDVGVLELSGLVKGRRVRVVNYFSEVSNLIQVDIEMTGEYADTIRRKVIDSFPEEAVAAAPPIGAFASGATTEGYVMYDYNTLASDVYANVPLFSRAYAFAGTPGELREKINALKDHYGDPANASISDGIAEIKSGPYLYQVKPVENGPGTKVALVVQTIPER